MTLKTPNRTQYYGQDDTSLMTTTMHQRISINEPETTDQHGKTKSEAICSFCGLVADETNLTINDRKNHSIQRQFHRIAMNSGAMRCSGHGVSHGGISCG